MAHLLFVDESGQDLAESPCEVLTGMAVRDATLWPFVQVVHQLEFDCFGTRYSAGAREIKARKLLKAKVFRLAEKAIPFTEAEQREAAKRALENGAGASEREYVALAKAKLKFAGALLEACQKFKWSLFSCIVPKTAPRPESPGFLRKDYSYLFERFFYFLEDRTARGAGIIVFDELEKSRSHILISQMDSYFKTTRKGRERSRLVIPEPFFVHSDLTTGIQLADLMAYLLAWGHFKPAGGAAPARPELTPFVREAWKLAYDSKRGLTVKGVTVIQDLRAREDREKQKGNVACATKPPNTV